jgi:UDP-N-acetylglucosamine:LPS N-acetylglucosamine transferase
MRVLAIASIGGHWVQLLRLRPAFKDAELIFMSTNECCSTMVPEHQFYSVPDSNRWNKLQLLISFWNIALTVMKIKPDVIITTGAAPGLMAIVAGRMLGIKTIWIDSIANIDEISLSGRIALKFANRVYTQWPHLASPKIHYSGSVL